MQQQKPEPPRPFMWTIFLIGLVFLSLTYHTTQCLQLNHSGLVEILIGILVGIFLNLGSLFTFMYGCLLWVTRNDKVR